MALAHAAASSLIRRFRVDVSSGYKWSVVRWSLRVDDPFFLFLFIKENHLIGVTHVFLFIMAEHCNVQVDMMLATSPS